MNPNTPCMTLQSGDAMRHMTNDVNVFCIKSRGSLTGGVLVYSGV